MSFSVCVILMMTCKLEICRFIKHSKNLVVSIITLCNHYHLLKIVKFKEMCILEWKGKILIPKYNHIQVDSFYFHKWSLIHQTMAVYNYYIGCNTTFKSHN